MSWTDERVEMLKELWTSGLSASQIAHKMGGVTRNAVIGKVHRLGLSGRAKPAQVSTSQVGAAQASEARVASVAGTTRRGGAVADDPRYAQAVAGASANVVRQVKSPEPLLTREQRASVLNLNERTCKWPFGDPGAQDFHFCGARVKTGSPYCEVHVALAYQPLERKRRKIDI